MAKTIEVLALIGKLSAVSDNLGSADLGSAHQRSPCISGVSDSIEALDQTALHAFTQVKDALGVWNDVVLEPGEVAVMFGQTATQASAGLLRPAVYRMVSCCCT